jgi:hypothetical protein
MTNELFHFGVLGMKWGRRKSDKTVSTAYLGKQQNDSSKRADIKSMSDDELRKVINRLQLEKQYSDLSSKDVSRGKQRLDKIMKAGTTVATVTTTGLTIYNNFDKIRKVVSKASKKAS